MRWTLRSKCGHGEGRGHDCKYVEWRSSLVPIASAMADARWPEPIGISRYDWRVWTLKWDAAFHQAMERLAKDPFPVAFVQGTTN